MSKHATAPIQFTRDELHLIRRRIAEVYVQRTPKVERLTDAILRKTALAEEPAAARAPEPTP